MSFFGFTEAETLPYMSILLVLGFILASNYLRGYPWLFSPLTIIAVIFSYYCLLGPFQAIADDRTFDRLQNMRAYYESAFWGALVLILSCVAGFHLHARKRKPEKRLLATDDQLFQYGRIVFLTGFILFTISTRGDVAKLINPLDAQAVETVGGGLANYLGLSLNFTIPGITLLFIYFIKTRKGLWWFLIPCIISLGIFTTLGFRYRIVLLVGSMAIAYFLLIRKKPNLIIAFVFPALFIILMGIINITRDYGRGLDIEKIEGMETEGYYYSGLREAMIFQTSGAVIDIVPELHPHAGWQPVISTLLFPIPRTIYPEKSSAEYLFDTLDFIYGENFSKGSAMMSYGEYYLAFGWLGIIVGGFLIGWFCKKLWNWYLSNPNNPFVIVTYAVTVSYLYVVLSRGYLPQVTMLFFFSVFPVFVVLWRIRKKSRIPLKKSLRAV